MTRVIVFDAGFNLGYGVLARDYVRSGTHRLEGSWDRMDVAFRSMNKTVKRVVEMHGPITNISACLPFVSFKANPINLIPLMGFYCKLQEIAADLGLPFYAPLYESDARKAFLSPAPIPRKSEQIKRAVYHAVTKYRGWPACDTHASDALCAADFLLSKIDKGANWDRTPLFINRTPA